MAITEFAEGREYAVSIVKCTKKIFFYVKFYCYLEPSFYYQLAAAELSPFRIALPASPLFPLSLGLHLQFQRPYV